MNDELRNYCFHIRPATYTCDLTERMCVGAWDLGMDGIKTNPAIMEKCPTRNAPEEMVFDLRNYLRSNPRPQHSDSLAFERPAKEAPWRFRN